MILIGPVDASALRATYPRDTLGMEDGEISVLLELEETALREQFSVTGTDASTTAALRRAMLLGWHSFLQQVRQVAQEQADADGHTVTYNRPGVIDFAWPAFVGAVLRRVADPVEVAAAAAPTEIRLRR